MEKWRKESRINKGVNKKRKKERNGILTEANKPGAQLYRLYSVALGQMSRC